jgi:hypothetical protein
VTDNKRLAKQTRKRLQIEHAPDLSREVKLVKLADKTCNLRDVAKSPPAAASVGAGSRRGNAIRVSLWLSVRRESRLYVCRAATLGAFRRD